MSACEATNAAPQHNADPSCVAECTKRQVQDRGTEHPGNRRGVGEALVTAAY